MTDEIKSAVDALRLFVMGEAIPTRQQASKHLETLVQHIQRGAVPEGWQLVPKVPTPIMVNAPTERDRYGSAHVVSIYTAMLAAPAPDHFHDAAEMVAVPAEVQCSRPNVACSTPDCGPGCRHKSPAPAEVPMPEPDVSTYEGYRDSAGEWHAVAYSVDQLLTYGAACRAAGEAAGYARGLKSRELSPEEKEDAVKYLALLRGEVKP